MNLKCWILGHELEGKIKIGSATYYHCANCDKYYAVGYDGIGLYRFEITKEQYEENKILSNMYHYKVDCTNCHKYNDVLIKKGTKVPRVVKFTCEYCGVENRVKS